MKNSIFKYIGRSLTGTALPENDEREGKVLLIRHGITCALLFVTLIITLLLSNALGWFSVNKNVSADGTRAGTEFMPFDLVTKGEAVRNLSVLNGERAEYIEGDETELTDGQGNTGKFYQANSLILRFNPSAQENSDTLDIGPDSSGELNLYVVPKTQDAIKVKVSLNIIAFAEIDEYEEQTRTVTDGQGNTSVVTECVKSGRKRIVEIKDVRDFTAQATALLNSEAVDEAAEYVKAADFLRGHIMFFGETGDTTNENRALRYYYKKPYTERYIETEIAAGNKGKAIQVPVYWMWPNTLGQIALPNNVSNQRSGYPILEDTDPDKSLLTEYLKTEKFNIFTNAGSDTEANINATSAAVANVADFNYDAFKELSTGYNRADYSIGTKIAYFMIEVVAEPV